MSGRSRQRPHPLVALLCAAACCGCMLAARPARAEFEELTADNAHTLGSGDFVLGVFHLDFGVFDNLMVGTHTVPWLIGMANARVKWRLIHAGGLALSVGLSAFRLDLKSLQRFRQADLESTGIAWLVPAEAYASYRLTPELMLNFGAVVTSVSVQGKYSREQFEGAAAVTNGQWVGSLEWRWLEGLALIAQARWLVFQVAEGGASATEQIDEFTRVEVHGSARSHALEVKDAMSLTASLQVILGSFNLKAGVGYGNWSLPLINLVVPRKTPIAEFDLFLRF